jgi:NADP-dependent 3-hydroxy acid dehydrogenase YdfG
VERSDVPAQKGRVAVVTGADTGLGFVTARALAAWIVPTIPFTTRQ